MTSVTDYYKNGAAQYARATATYTPGYFNNEIHGTPQSAIFVQQMGQVVTASAQAIVLATIGASGALVFSTGIAVGVGVATTAANLSTGTVYTIARKVAITATVNASTATATITGTDFYGATIVCTMPLPNNSTTYSPVAFKTITAISQSLSATAAVSYGTSDIYGTQFRLSDAGRFISITADGITCIATTAPTAGLAATGTATATTADVRGTVLFPSTALADGSKYLTMTYLVPGWGLTSTQSDNKETTYGATPFAG